MQTLTGLNVESFQHPAEKKALDSINKAKWFKKLLDWVAEKETQFALKVNALGSCIMVTPESMPKLYQIMDEVKQTLDYDVEIRIFTHRSFGFDIEVYAGNPSMIIVPDFIINDFDDDMIRFEFGRAVTTLKADTVQLTIALYALRVVVGNIPAVGEIMTAGLADWARKATLTQDRGGLLACQDKEAAYRALFRRCGLPMRYMDAQIIPKYAKSYQLGEKIVNAAQYAKTITKTSPWNNDRLLEMLNWIQSGGYDDIIEEYE